jgi:NTP pyrophosphatase (non-canonical NTP hydrolase)
LLDNDNMSLNAAVKKIIEFRNERDWSQFHSPKNLAEAISIEASELLEIFL